MKMIMQRLLSFITVSLLLVSLPLSAFAHSGRTDSSGGHKDNKNKSGLGSYHYHCGGYPAHLHDGGYCPYTDVMPSSVRVSAEKTTLKLGEKVSVSGSVYPENSCNTSVSWSCSDESVAKVSNGYIEAVGYGTATITVTSFNNKVGTLKITVPEITAKSISIEEPEDLPEEIFIRNTISLTATITPSDVDNPAITWTSSDESIATVSDTGTVTPLAEGSAVITATTSNGKTDEFEITILEKQVESVEIKEGSERSLLIEETAKLSAVVLPEDASFPEITWTSSDEDIVSVDKEGNLTAKACGTATVSAATANGITDTITVTVTEVVAEKLEIQGANKIKIGSETDVTAVFYPADTTIQRVEWSSDDEDIAAVDEKGHIVANNVGKATIIATAKDVQTEFVLEVEPIAVERIDITTTIGEKFKSGDEADFTATVYPANATYPEVTWSISDSKVATIDAKGHLVAESSGKVTVTAETGDGFTETYELSIALSDAAVAMIAGGSGAAGIAGVATLVVKNKKKKRTWDNP